MTEIYKDRIVVVRKKNDVFKKGEALHSEKKICRHQETTTENQKTLDQLEKHNVSF
jgi:hypothetical protein